MEKCACRVKSSLAEQKQHKFETNINLQCLEINGILIA